MVYGMLLEADQLQKIIERNTNNVNIQTFSFYYINISFLESSKFS